MEEVGLVSKQISKNNLQMTFFPKTQTHLISIENVPMQHVSYLGKESDLAAKNLNKHWHQSLIKRCQKS